MDGKKNEPPTLAYNWIALIDALPKPMPGALRDMQSIFADQLRLLQHDRIIAFYEAGPLKTRDGVVIRRVTARAGGATPDRIDILVLELDEHQCVPLKPVREAFGLNIPIPPNGIEPGNTWGYRKVVEWGIFAVKVTNARPDCVDNLVVRTKDFGPKYHQPESRVPEAQPLAHPSVVPDERGHTPAWAKNLSGERPASLWARIKHWARRA